VHGVHRPIGLAAQRLCTIVPNSARPRATSDATFPRLPQAAVQHGPRTTWARGPTSVTAFADDHTSRNPVVSERLAEWVAHVSLGGACALSSGARAYMCIRRRHPDRPDQEQRIGIATTKANSDRSQDTIRPWPDVTRSSGVTGITDASTVAPHSRFSSGHSRRSRVHQSRRGDVPWRLANLEV